MEKQIPEFRRQALLRCFRGIIDISAPNNSGTQNNVYFVNTNDGDFVAKFGCRDMVFKNCFIGRQAARHGIAVPDTSIAEYKGNWIEKYPMIVGKTLFEHIRDGMSEPVVRLTFENMLTQFVRMGDIDASKICSDNKCITIHNAAYEHARNSNGAAFATFVRPILYMLNRGRSYNSGLYHSDLTPKNVIVNEKGNIISIIDLDSMAICNRDFAFSALADKWCNLGFNPHELYDKYEYLLGQPVNRARISSMLRTIHLGKYLMFKTHKHKQK